MHFGLLQFVSCYWVAICQVSIYSISIVCEYVIDDNIYDDDASAVSIVHSVSINACMFVSFIPGNLATFVFTYALLTFIRNVTYADDVASDRVSRQFPVCAARASSSQDAARAGASAQCAHCDRVCIIPRSYHLVAASTG